MKAYEIKVTIKNSKPPIWRKIVIPADINFMQLHNIIQTAFEWLNYHLYEFDLKDFSLKITNDEEAVDEEDFFISEETEAFCKAMGLSSFKSPKPEKFLLAKDVPIADYFDKVKKLTYVYDFGDWWEHTIEILNVIDDYDGNCPVVTKFKQASPPDDCGGIYGYYEFLEQYNSGEEELTEWAEEQGYTGEYDIDKINGEMEYVLDLDFDNIDEL